MEKEVRNQEIHAFSQSIAAGHRLGLLNDRLATFVATNARKLNDALAPERDREFEYFGLRTLYDRYLLKHLTSRLVLETPCAVAQTLDASVAAVNQGGKRKGACCVYLEPWHGDIEEFLELRDNTGDEARRTHNLNLANWIPDLFMRRVEADAPWSLFDPKTVPELPDLYGEAFELRYEAAERVGEAIRTVKARDLYARIMRTLAQTGNG